MLSLILLILIAVLALSVLILVHEFGHFVVAKRGGVWVEEFGIGIPPRVFGKKIGETLYSINALPLGGFVRLHGETVDENVTKPSRAFLNKSKKLRIAVALAGVSMNILFAVVVFTIINFATGVPRETNTVRVTAVAPNSPAEEAGLRAGDVVLSVEEQVVQDLQNFNDIIGPLAGSEVSLLVKSGDSERQVQVVPRENPPEGEGALGVVVSGAELVKPPLIEQPIVYTWEALKQTWFLSQQMLIGFASIFGALGQGSAPQGVAGPLGVTALLVEIAKLGILPLLEFMAIISINLALINLIPFPPLDGSRVVFVAIEGLIGKKVRPNIESMVYTTGMVLLVGLLLVLTASEIPKLLTAGSLSTFVQTLFQ